MKLKNKRTGEIVELLAKPSFVKRDKENYLASEVICFDSLAELNAEWQDYEDDELLYVISAEHKSGYQCVLKDDYPEICKIAKELGIGFETEKECQIAVEKLKAWKRLKDKGFRFDDWNWKTQWIGYNLDYTDITEEQIEEAEKDLDLLFGGEE